MRLINADKIHPDVRTQHGALAISQGQLAYAETVNAILIPENATNGDVIKAIFPNADFDNACPFCDGRWEIMPLNTDVYKPTQLRTYKDWWNAPYKAESGV